MSGNLSLTSRTDNFASATSAVTIPALRSNERSSEYVRSRGTEYGSAGVEAYAKFGHGSDMTHFLDPFIARNLRKQDGKKVLDAGCGAAPWSIYAAQHGASVEAIDIQQGMIDKAKAAVTQAGLGAKVKAAVGDATATSYKDETFDHSISINVGCNLPKELLQKHFDELGRVAKESGTVDVALPDSLDVVFTDGSKKDSDVRAHIDQVLEELPDNPEPALIQEKLGQLKEITSATFTIEKGRLVLVDDQTKVNNGQKIWRKLHAVTIPNYYHSSSEYYDAFAAANLKLVGIARRRFQSDLEREKFNLNQDTHPKLGGSYVQHEPFVVYHLQKQSPSCFTTCFQSLFSSFL